MTWDDYFTLAKDYYTKNGNLLIPQKYVTESGVKLGVWINAQRRAYNGTSNSKISERQISQLNSIGMAWKIKNRSEWGEAYLEAQDYYLSYGNLLVPFGYITSSGRKLGNWISEQRCQFKKNNLSSEKIKLLNEIGMVWQVANSYTWNQAFEKAKQYYITNGNLLVPQNYVDSDGFTLGIWITNQRMKKKNSKLPLSDEQIAKLDSIGMVWNVKEKHSWDFYYEYALQYYEQHLNLLIPVNYEVDGVKLGNWIANQRRARKSYCNKLNEIQIALLDNIGMVWEINQRTVSKKKSGNDG